MLFVNGLCGGVRTFLAERSGTPIDELVGICREEASVRANNATSTLLLSGNLDHEAIEMAIDHLTAAREFLNVAEPPRGRRHPTLIASEDLLLFPSSADCQRNTPSPGRS